MDQLNKRRVIISMLLGILASSCMNLSLAVHSIKELEQNASVEHMHLWFRLVWDLKMSWYGYSVKECLLAFLLGFVFYYAMSVAEKRTIQYSAVPAALFAFFEVFGRSFKETASWHQVFDTGRNMVKAGIKFVGLFLLFCALIVLFLHWIERIKFGSEDTVCEKTWFTANKKSFFVVMGLILLMWLPYAISYFPGLSNYDFFDMLDTFYGNDTNSLRVVVPISEDVTLNNNNPVLQTMMAVGFMKIGDLFGSGYVGIFLFCYLQMILFSAVLSYSIYFMAKLQIKQWLRVVVLLFYGLLPWHANFALTTLKDTNFAFSMLLYMIFLMELWIDPDTFFAKKKKWLLFTALNLLLMLLRNNGVYILILVDAVLLIRYRNYWKKLLLPTVGMVFVYVVLITHILYPALKISPGSKAEMYSVPIQQIARLVKEHDKQIEPQDKEIIKKILPKYEELAKRYNPELADPVKSTYNKYATGGEMREFLSVWFKYLLRYPALYIQATMSGCYGYFYPEAEHWLVYTKIEPPGLNYGVESPKELTTWRQEMNQMAYLVKSIPGISLFVSIGFYTWIMVLFIAVLIYRKKNSIIIIWLPIVLLILTVFLGPANTMPRYVYSMILSVPMLSVVSCFLSEKRNEINEDTSDNSGVQ